MLSVPTTIKKRKEMLWPLSEIRNILYLKYVPLTGWLRPQCLYLVSFSLILRGSTQTYHYEGGEKAGKHYMFLECILSGKQVPTTGEGPSDGRSGKWQALFSLS